MNFKVGDQVKYVSGRHGNSVNNPLWNGTQGKVWGTICLSQYLGYVGVHWNNGTHNNYFPTDLALVERKGKSHPLTTIFKDLTKE